MILDLGEITPNSNRSERVQVAKVGTFEHEIYGRFTISYDDLKFMEENFKANVRRQALNDKPVVPFDYSHDEEGKAAGWIDNLVIDKDKNGVPSLFASVEWTPKGAENVRQGEFKFTSPSIKRNYKDAETGKIYNIVLKGAALTNVPFLRDMEAIYLLSEDKQKAFESLKLSGSGPDQTDQKGFKMPTIEEIVSALPELSPEDKKQLFDTLAASFEKEMKEKTDQAVKMALAEKEKEMSKNLSLSEKNASDLKKQIVELTAKMEKQDKEREFNIMLSEGKVCEAQRAPFLEGNFAEFAAKYEPFKLDVSGSQANKGTQDAESRVHDLAEKKIDEAKSKGQSLDYSAAVTMVLSENKELANLVG